MSWTMKGGELEFIGPLTYTGYRLPILNVQWLEDNVIQCRGRRRSHVTLAGYRAGEAPPNKGKRYPPTPPSQAEVLRMLGHSNLGTTATYLQAIAPFEVVNAMTARPAPEGLEASA